MSLVNLEATQKLLKLNVSYPYFPTWTETLEFVIDGVVVKAVAFHAWRRVTIRIIEPIALLAWIFEPPMIALGISMLHREACLNDRKMTDSEDCLLRAKTAYRRHMAYLGSRTSIEAAQSDLISVFEYELVSLLSISESVQNRVDTAKKEESRKFKAGVITQKEYQANLKSLKAQISEANLPYFSLKIQVERELSDIKQSMISKMLATL